MKFQVSFTYRSILRLCLLLLTALSTRPTYISHFLYHLVTPPPNTLLSVAFNVLSPLSFTRYSYTFTELYVIQIEFVPTRHLPSFIAHLWTPLRLPASVAVSRVCLPPLSPLGIWPCHCWSMGGLLMLVPPSTLCPRLSPSLFESSSPIIFWYFFSFSSCGLFRARSQGAGAYPIYGSPLPRSSPSPAIWSCQRRTGSPAPHPPSPLSLLLYLLDTIPAAEVFGA